MARSAYDAGLSYFPDYPVNQRGLGFLGTTTDDARQARADYFGELAIHGNVAAARILIGGTQNTSGNEQPMWLGWLQKLQSIPLGLQTYQTAKFLGAWWPVGSTDTVTEYPIMKAFVKAWADLNIPPPPIVPTPDAAPPPPPPPALPPPPTPAAAAPPTTAPVADGSVQLAGLSLSPTMLLLGAGGAIALTWLLRRD